MSEYYQFPNAEVADISEHLTGNGAQAVQYIARATRLDGKNKGDVIDDSEKAIWFIDREVWRLKDEKAAEEYQKNKPKKIAYQFPAAVDDIKIDCWKD